MSDQGRFYLIMFGIIAGLALLGGGGYVVYENYKQRGIRNNNPGNLRPSASAWQGIAGTDDGIGGPFLIFKAPEWGIRALYRTLMTYRTKYNLDTIGKIITRWAPPSENNTAAYIAAVSKAMGKKASDQLSLSDYPALIENIIKHENGIQPYPRDLINKGISLA